MSGSTNRNQRIAQTDLKILRREAEERKHQNMFELPAQIIELIRLERERQNEKWGEQNHNPFIWHTILAEEIGEIANAVLENEFSNGVGHNADHIAVEIIQSIAVGVAWLECLDRHELIRLDALSLNA